MLKLKTILQSNLTYCILIILCLIYVLTLTVVIKYKTSITNFNELEGIIIKGNVTEDKISFVLKTKENVNCLYYSPKQKYNIEDLLGKKVHLKGNIGNLYNNTIPNTFNYKNYLYHNHIYVNYIVKDLEIIDDENIFYTIKNKIYKRIRKYDSLTSSYLSLFILGDKNNIDEDVIDIYRSNGIWHLFAISGMHIGFIVLVLNKLLKKFKFKNLIISLILLYFIFLTNYTSSVLRAVIFYILKCLNNYKNFNLTNLKILFLTAFLILLVNPFSIYDTGFLYSFLITLAILLCSKNINGHYFQKILKISLLSFIVSLPITVNINYEINFLSLLLNLIYVPFVSLIVFPLALLTFFIKPLAIIFKITITILEVTNKFFHSFSFSLIIPKMSFIVIIIYYVILLIYLKIKKKRIFLLTIILIYIHILIPKLDKNAYIYYLDVSQGDSEIIISENKKSVIMMDTGGLINSDTKFYKNIILFLKSLGIKKIDLLITTHGDYDHMGESTFIVNNFSVQKVIFNCGEFNSLEKNLQEELKEKHITYNSCVKELDIKNNKLYFLNTQKYDNENDNSNILYMKIKNYQFLFMGDASVKVEKEILNKYNIFNIDVLKVGHHGSKTSSSKEFIDTIKPLYTIISVGKNNRYGHPNKETLENIKDSKIYRTDIDGSIAFKITNKKLSVKTFEP